MGRYEQFFSNTRKLLLLIFFTTAIELHGKELSFGCQASYYLSTNERFRELYSNSMIYGVEATVGRKSCINYWVNIGYLYGSGTTEGVVDSETDIKGSSQIDLIPLSFGLAKQYNLGIFTAHLGLGPLFAYSHIHNCYDYVTSDQYGWGGGAVAKASLRYRYSNCLQLNLMTNYSLIKIHYQHGNKRTTHYPGDASGFSFGIGIDYKLYKK